LLRGSIAIVGLAEYGLGVAPEGSTPTDVMGNAALAALADAGLSTKDVDGLFAASTQLPWASVNLGEFLGVQPRYSDSTQLGGSSFMAHLHHAALAITGGACEVAVIGYGSTQRSVGRAKASVQEIDPAEAPYRPMNPVTAYALAAARHMHEFGTTREQLAEVAVAARKWAQRNPDAWSKKDLTVQDVLSAPMVADPLGVKDCCLVTDGGAAVVVTSAERARSLTDRPVYLLGAGEAHSHRHISHMPDLVRTSAVDSGRRAFDMAGLTPADVDVLQLYDAFTITPVLFLEDLGFCAKGEGGPFVSGGRIAPGGELALNTNGGGLSYQHPGMYGLLAIVEAARQLRGESTGQVDGAHVSLAHGNGGVLSTQCTVVLGDESTL
jgi:acetyl-CoA acetyltransferase